MKYAVYQIQLSDAQVDLINDKGHDAVPAQVAKLKMSADYNGDRIGQTAVEAFDAGYYTHVADITADCVGDVYTIGNCGPRSSITRISPMSSVSVGDVIVDETGCAVVVAPVGFVNFSFRPELIA